ncbi:hypothetical protein PIB30_050116 [Stylosanthes scabra]|uniref:Uncharacterized protein n=1 Tax=Stylosanthes scabra TaxID=79078 RepID=A0ABU6SII4_9FABA|nr:hypothetical protein [Stylosanthes scabra]
MLSMFRGDKENVFHETHDQVSYDPEIERTLRNLRRIRCQDHFENHSVVQPENTTPEEETIYSSSSESDFELPFSDTGTVVMADNPNQGLTLRELCSSDLAFQLQHARYPELNANFELKSGLTNLLP